MKNVSIIVPKGDGNNLSSIVGTFKLLSRANEYWVSKEQAPLFSIKLVGLEQKSSFYHGLFDVNPHCTLHEVSQTDLIIIPSLNHHYHENLESNQAWVDWILFHYKSGAEIACICTGAFLLAATGLLDGKRCSTHWSATQHFRKMYPAVELEPDLLITDENGIYTNGGAYSFLNLILYLIEKYFDRETAVYCAKVFQIDIGRNFQNEFIIFKGLRQHHDELILQAQNFIESNFSSKITIGKLSAMLHIGRRTFDRRFVKATGYTPVEYAQQVRVEVAKKAFETNRKTVGEVMYEVGYSDVKAFREIFRKTTGMSPLAYKTKYFVR